MTDQFDGKGPYVERLDLVDDSLGAYNNPRCSLDVRVEMTDGTVLESNVLRLQSFSGTEGISQAFEFKLDIRANDYTFYDSVIYRDLIDEGDGQPRLNMDALLGASITVLIGLAETDEEASEPYPVHRKVSTFNGIVFDVAMSDRGIWNITMKPRISLLAFQSSYRMFEEQTILEVIESIFSQNGISYTSSALLEGGIVDDSESRKAVVTGLATYRSQSWLQAGETDLDFLNRLMEKAGIFYYFVHSLSDHLMVLTDQNYYQVLLEPKEDEPNESSDVKTLYLTSPTLGLSFEDGISQFSFQRSIAVRGVSTILAHKQASWESADAAEVAPVYRDDRLSQPTLSMEKMHIVSYGAGEKELDIRKALLEKQLLSAKSTLSGSSGCPSLRSGYVFELAEARDVWDLQEDTLDRNDRQSMRGLRSMLKQLRHLRFLRSRENRRSRNVNNKTKEEPLTLQDGGDFRPELEGAQMVAVSVSHDAKIDGSYSNQFSAFDKYGFGKAFEATGDQDGSIVAQVCDMESNTNKSSSTAIANVTKFLKKSFVSKFFLEKTAFVDKHQKDFTTTDIENPLYKAVGVYVQFINSNVDSTPVWVRLSDSMTTIPERGAFVLVGRARDDTEVTEVQQVIDSVGSKTIMPQLYTKNTSLGNSYSTSYGDSHRVSVPMDPKTSYETFTSIVEDNSSDEYSDVSFSENSPYNFNFSPKSFSRSVSGNVPEDTNLATFFDSPKLTQANVQASQSKIYGDTYSYSYQSGNTYNETRQDGDQTNSSTQTGRQVSTTTIEGDTISTSTQNGISDSRTANTVTNSASAVGSSSSESSVGASTSVSTTGLSISASATVTSLSASSSGVSVSASSADMNVSTSTNGMNVSTSTTGVDVSESTRGTSISSSTTALEESTSLTEVSNRTSIVALSNSVDISGLVEGTSIRLEGEKLTMHWPGGSYQNYPDGPDIKQTTMNINMIALIKIEM